MWKYNRKTDEVLSLIVGSEVKVHFSNQTNQVFPRNLLVLRECRLIKQFYLLVYVGYCYLFCCHFSIADYSKEAILYFYM